MKDKIEVCRGDEKEDNGKRRGRVEGRVVQIGTREVEEPRVEVWCTVVESDVSDVRAAEG